MSKDSFRAGGTVGRLGPATALGLEARGSHGRPGLPLPGHGRGARPESLLDPGQDASSPLAEALLPLRQRSEALRPVVAELKALAQAGHLSTSLEDLALSYLHMHANRLLRSAARAQELVLYDFLLRLYESRLARLRKGSTGSSPPSGP